MKQMIELTEGFDVTNSLGVTQFIAPEPAVMGGDAKGLLQNVGILVSDEERIENLRKDYDKMRQFRYFKTEKLEGTSCTVYIKDGKFGVCSRTIDYKRPDEDVPWDKMNVYWKVALQLDLERIMNEMRLKYGFNNFSLQGELVGEGIQKNIYKLKGHRVCFYNGFDIDAQEYFEFDAFVHIIEDAGLEVVPIVDYDYELPEDSLELLKEADESKTVFGNNPNQLIEGYVYVAKGEIPADVRVTRSSFSRLSFKVKSRTYDMNK